MRLPTLAALLGCAASAGCASGDTLARAAPAGILLDGGFDDWAAVPVLLEDPVDAAAPSPVELTTLRAADDPAWLHLSVRVGRPVNVQAMRGTLHLVLDADGDAATGGPAFGLDGADLLLDLSQTEEPQPGGFGAGFSLRPVGPDGPGAPRSSYDLGVAALPTWATDRFELRVARGGAADGFGRMGPTVRMRMVVTVEGQPVEETDVAAYVFASPPGADPAQPTLEPLLEKAEGAVRVAQWNVAEGSFRRPEGHARLLAAVRPDVVLLDEVYEEISDSLLAAFFAHPDLAALGTWRWVYARAGGRQKTVVAARDRAIRQEPGMARVEYAPGALDSLKALVPEAAHRMLDLEARLHMSATGAWVDVGGTEVLFVPVDLQSAGYLGSPHDLLRDLQAETLLRHVDAASARTDGRAPVVVGGDFNPVGSGAPLSILARGLDADGSDLTLADPRRLGEASLLTWMDDRRGPFAPGRLDVTLYADAALEWTGGFVFDSGDLTDEQLARLGLERELSGLASDHRIVVSDLRVR